MRKHPSGPTKSPLLPWAHRPIWACLLFLYALVYTPASPPTALGARAYAATGDSSRLIQQAGQAKPPLRLAFTHVTAQQGLASDNAWAVVQDNAGFIWIGTINGLSRYSGSSMVTYQNNSDDPTSLSNNFVRTLFVDNSGKLWVGTNSGLDAYDGATDRFRVYLHDAANPQSLSASAVQAIYQDGSGIFWVGTDGGGLDRFDPATGVFTAYRHDPADSHSLSSDSVRDIEAGENGDLWVATYGGGLDRFDPATGVFSTYRHDPADPKSISSDLVWTVARDPSGDLWVGTWGGGLNLFHPGTGTVTIYRHDPANTGTLDDDIVTALRVDSSGALWVGTYSGGVSIFNPAAGSFVSYAADASDGESLRGNRVRDLYEDRTGLMWVATDGGGVNTYNPQQRAFTLYRNSPSNSNSLSGDVAYAVYEDPGGTAWVGTEAGLDSLDPTTGRVRHYPPDPSNPQKSCPATIFGITGDGKDGVWIATYGGGLCHLDPATGVYTGYRHDLSNPNSLMDDSINAIAVDKTGGLWLPTTVGLAYFDPATGEFKAYRNEPGNPRSLTPGEVYSVIVASDGTVWTSGTSGLSHLDPASGMVTRYQHNANDPRSLSDSFVFKLYQDAAGSVWAAGFDGILNRFDPKTGGFDHFLRSSAAPAENIGAMLDEMIGGKPTGNLWVWRNRSLVKLDPGTGQFRVYTTADGLPTEQATRGGTLGDNGQLLLGSTAGLIIVDPTKLQIDNQPPQLAFTDFQLANKPVSIGESSVLKEAIDKTDRVQLTYEDRVITFGFTALSFRGPQLVRYRYKLDGFDTDWNETDSTRRLVTYTNLNPGQYVFRVTASNADGVWNETGRAITLVITPPWWDMTEVRVLAILLLILGLFAAYGWRVSSLQRRQRALEAAVSQRTSDLARANTALQTEVAERQGAERALDEANANLRERVSELTALNAIGQALARVTDITAALEAVAGAIVGIFDAAIGIWQLDEPHVTLNRLVAAAGETATTETDQVALDDDSVSQLLVAFPSVAVVGLAEPQAVIAQPPHLPVDEGAGTYMLVPLRSHGEVVGIVCIRALSPERSFTRADIALARTMGAILTNAILNSRLFEQAQIAAAEEERRRIARELHDSVSQALYAANISAEVLPRLLESSPGRAHELLDTLHRFTSAAAAEMRMLLVELRPAAIVDTPLHELLLPLAEATRARSAAAVEEHIERVPRLSPDVQIAFYRIAQEALNNIATHADAHHVVVDLRFIPEAPETSVEGEQLAWSGTVEMQIADDGRGFDTQHGRQGRLGLGGMRERVESIGAQLIITSSPGTGTRVSVAWPYPDTEPGSELPAQAPAT